MPSVFGKFDSIVTEWLYEVSLHGGADEEAGSVTEAPGTWYGLMNPSLYTPDMPKDLEIDLELDQDDIDALQGSVGAIILETTQGFVYSTLYDDKDKLDKDWQEILEECYPEEEEATA